MKDITQSKYRKSVSEIIKSKTNQSYSEFCQKAVERALGELINGRSSRRRSFEKEVVNEAFYDLFLEFDSKTTQSEQEKTTD